MATNPNAPSARFSIARALRALHATLVGFLLLVGVTCLFFRVLFSRTDDKEWEFKSSEREELRLSAMEGAFRADWYVHYTERLQEREFWLIDIPPSTPPGGSLVNHLELCIEYYNYDEPQGSLKSFRYVFFYASSASVTVIGIGLSIYPVWFMLRKPIRRRLRKRRGCCTECGYNLAHNVSGRCPECGAVAPRQLPGAR